MFVANNIFNFEAQMQKSSFARNDDHHDHNTRVRRSLHVPVGKTASVYRTFRFCGIKIWNYIEANIIIDTSYSSFKYTVKNHLMYIDIKDLYNLINFNQD